MIKSAKSRRIKQPIDNRPAFKQLHAPGTPKLLKALLSGEKALFSFPALFTTIQTELPAN
jgi:hypothetical protein